MAEILFGGALLVLLIILANIIEARGSQRYRQLFLTLLALANGGVAMLGLWLLVVPEELMATLAEQMPMNPDNLRNTGLLVLLMGLWGVLTAITPVRRLLGRVMPLDADSTVHALALILSGYLVGQGALTLSQGGLAGLAETTSSASVGLVVVQAILFAGIALLGVGALIRRGGPSLRQRLGLTWPSPRELLIGLAAIAGLVVLQGIGGALWAVTNPEQAEILESVNATLLGDFDTVGEWLILALAAGIGEELLFRGALQPVLGLGFTAVLFASVHIQFGYSAIMLIIVGLALVLGFIRRRYSTTLAVFVHAGYNFTLGLLSLLATQLEPLMR
ncbi:MAG: CPBP family intramembrane glutamic endopeptidase [Candidatus Promineifilaceae bacterium]|nr:CPBP family intramembrane glutamic endopeptidase [Candidatus Promineifilaceae bacterium]